MSALHSGSRVGTGPTGEDVWWDTALELTWVPGGMFLDFRGLVNGPLLNFIPALYMSQTLVLEFRVGVGGGVGPGCSAAEQKALVRILEVVRGFSLPV